MSTIGEIDTSTSSIIDHRFIDTSTHRHIDTSTHRHIDSSTHRHIDSSTHRPSTHRPSTHRFIDSSIHRLIDHRFIDSSTHRFIDHRHIDSSTHRFIDTSIHRPSTHRFMEQIKTSLTLCGLTGPDRVSIFCTVRLPFSFSFLRTFLRHHRWLHFAWVAPRIRDLGLETSATATEIVAGNQYLTGLDYTRAWASISQTRRWAERVREDNGDSSIAR